VKRRREKGNAFVEFAISIGPLLVLMMLVFEVSRWAWTRGQLHHAVREGARFAITYSPSYNGESCTSTTACVKKVIEDNSLGMVKSANADTYVRVRYYSPDNLATPLEQNQLPKTLADGRRITNLNQTGNLIEVQLQGYPWNWAVPFTHIPGYSTSLSWTAMTISVESSDVMQGLPVGQFTYPNP
jgi:Flp pilus assembly protein TadG